MPRAGGSPLAGPSARSATRPVRSRWPRPDLRPTPPSVHTDKDWRGGSEDGLNAPDLNSGALAFPGPRNGPNDKDNGFVSPDAPHDAPVAISDGGSRAPSDPHHLRFAQPRTLGRKVSDGFTVPLR